MHSMKFTGGLVSKRIPLRIVRLKSDKTLSEEEIRTAKTWLKSFSSSEIPRSLFEISYSRSSGPGGQKVNKTSSKATISLDASRWMNPQFCYWIPAAIRSQLLENKIRYENKNGGISIQSDSSRNREVNAKDCFHKLLREIKDNSFFDAEVSEEDKKRWDEIRQDSDKKRLFQKRHQSDKKKSRSKKFEL